MIRLRNISKFGYFIIVYSANVENAYSAMYVNVLALPTEFSKAKILNVSLSISFS